MNKLLSPDEMGFYQSILERNAKDILSRDGVVDIGFGYPIKNGELLANEIAIIIYVIKKFNEHELGEEQVLPKVIEGIPVDIIESNPEEQIGVENPLVGGIGISNVNLSGRGTLGVIVRKLGNDNIFWGLTNWHVIKRKRGKLGDIIVEPAWKPNNSTFRIGKLVNFDKNLDCAVFEIVTTRNFLHNVIKTIGVKIEGIYKPSIGLPVMKFGASTGLTYGIVSFISNNKTNVTITPNNDKPAQNNEISMSGDSGSLWITDEDHPKAVALHYAGDKDNTFNIEFAYAMDIEIIAKKMGFEFNI